MYSRDSASVAPHQGQGPPEATEDHPSGSCDGIARHHAVRHGVKDRGMGSQAVNYSEGSQHW